MVGAQEDEKEAGPWQPANKKHKQTPLSQLTREELEARVRQLEAHNTQLRNLLTKSQAGGASDTPSVHTKPQKQRQFDFSKHSRRHVALKLCYLGWDYQGFAVQEDSQNTIEAQLFAALLKTRLIESRETSNYHRCGRTDKGVSAFDQVISITLRSKLKKGLGVLGLTQGAEGAVCERMEGQEEKEKEEVVKEDEEEEGDEINYVQLLNRVLPQEIRVLAWCPVPQGFSARFDCCRRTYKYFFPRGGLDLQAMQEAGQHLVGEHDYRNLCKMDVGNGVVNFRRRILAVRVERAKQEDGGGGGDEGRVANVDGEDGGTGGRGGKRRTGRSEDGECGKGNSGGGGGGGKEGGKCDGSSKEENEGREEGKDSGVVGEGREQRKDSGVLGGRNEGGDLRSCSEGRDGYEMCVATIEGQAFLWHQVRAVMAVLFLVGEGKERPDIVATLLDVQTHPRKPQYSLASDFPLSLWSVEFSGVAWRWEEAEVRRVVAQMQGTWAVQAVRATMIGSMLSDLEARYKDLAKARLEKEEKKEEEEQKEEEKEKPGEKKDPVQKKKEGEMKRSEKRKKDEDEEVCEGREVREQVTPLMTGTRTKVYRPLLSRPTCESLEQRVEHYVKRQRLDPGLLQNLT